MSPITLSPFIPAVVYIAALILILQVTLLYNILMNLINSFNLLSSVSTEVAKTASMLASASSRNLKGIAFNRSLRSDIIRKGNVACNFNLTDAYLADKSNTEIYTYEAGDACSFGVTTISYMTSPVTHNILNGVNSNTFELQTCYHLAVMPTNDKDGPTICFENANIKTSSTQYRDGSASFVIAGGEIALNPKDVEEWASIAVNGKDTVETPGFYYMEEGYAAGDVVFVSAFEAEANYTNFRGKYVDLCESIEDYGATPAPTPSTVFDDSEDAVEKGNLACGFNANVNDAEVHTYEAGEACPFAITTVSYMTSPLSEQVTSGFNSNTYELTASYHLAAMRDNDGIAYCIDNASLKAGSTQYRDGSATFSGVGGEHVLTSDSTFGDWTSINVNGGDSVNGFYYMEDGVIEGEVIFTTPFETIANFTKIEGTFIELCQAIENSVPTAAPTPSSGFEKNICKV